MVEALVKYLEEEKKFKVLIYDTAKAPDPMMVLKDYGTWERKEFPKCMVDIVSGDRVFAKIDQMYFMGEKLVTFPMEEVDVKPLCGPDDYARIAIDWTGDEQYSVLPTNETILNKLHKVIKYNFEARPFYSKEKMEEYKPDIVLIVNPVGHDKEGSTWSVWNVTSGQYMTSVILKK